MLFKKIKVNVEESKEIISDYLMVGTSFILPSLKPSEALGLIYLIKYGLSLSKRKEKKFLEYFFSENDIFPKTHEAVFFYFKKLYNIVKNSDGLIYHHHKYEKKLLKKIKNLTLIDEQALKQLDYNDLNNRKVIIITENQDMYFKIKNEIEFDHEKIFIDSLATDDDNWFERVDKLKMELLTKSFDLIIFYKVQCGNLTMDLINTINKQGINKNF